MKNISLLKLLTNCYRNRHKREITRWSFLHAICK